MSATGNLYAAQYVGRLLTQSAVAPPDTSRANGTGEFLQELYRTYRDEGQDAARMHWRNIVQAQPWAKEIDALPKRVHYSASDLQTIPPLKWLIKGLIPERGFTVMYGAPGCGKSFLALHYACKIAQERPVLYWAGEGVSGYSKRVKAWSMHNNVPMESLKLMFDFGSLDVLHAHELNLFIEWARDLQPVLIVLDTLAQCMSGDENSSADMNGFTRACRVIQNELNTAVLVLHHTTKSTGDLRGHGSLRGAADSTIQVNMSEDLRQVVNDKAKDAGENPTFTVKLLEIKEADSCAMMVVNAEKELENRLTEAEISILLWLNTYAYAQGARNNDLASIIGRDRAHISRACNRLHKRGLLIKEGKYDPWVLTEQGKHTAKTYESKGYGLDGRKTYNGGAQDD